MIRPYRGALPQIAASAYIDPSAQVIGNVTIGERASVWPNVTIRGDVNTISIGEETNIQDNSTLHCDAGLFPLIIGNRVTVGHQAMLHGCTIGDHSLIGMGAILLNGAKIGSHCLVGAGAVITEGKTFPDGSLIVGAPARPIREVDENTAAMIAAGADIYVRRWKRYVQGLKRIG